MSGVCTQPPMTQTQLLRKLEREYVKRGEELEQAKDMLTDAQTLITMIADHLGLMVEPHQTFNERLLERAKQGGDAIFRLQGLEK